MRPLEHAIRLVVADVLRDVHVAIPGRLTKYDWETSRGEVEPLTQVPMPDGSALAIKPLAGVPVAQWGGATASLSLPLEAGDTGLLIFTDGAIERWLSEDANLPPPDPRTHDLSDAVFLPGLRSFKAGGLAEAVDVLALKNGAAKLKMQGGKVALGSDQAELLDLFDQMLNLLITAVVPTMLGPQPLSTVASGQVADLRNKLALIKGSL